MLNQFKNLFFKISFILVCSVPHLVLANTNSYCGDSQVITFYRDRCFIEKDIPNERRLRLMAGAFSSTISGNGHEYTLSTKWENFDQPGCFTLTKEVFSAWDALQGNLNHVVINGNIIEAKSGNYPFLNCHQLGKGGRYHAHGRTMENEAQHNALFACKSQGHSSCQQLSSSCIPSSSGATWKVIMEGV